MARRRKRRIKPDLTPLIDVVFLLLIFFLVSSMFKKKETSLDLQLPKVEQEVQLKNEKMIMIELSQNQLVINGTEYAWEQMTEAVAQLKKSQSSSKPVHFLIDKKTEYERVAQLLDQLKLHGLQNIQLVQESDKRR